MSNNAEHLYEALLKLGETVKKPTKAPKEESSSTPAPLSKKNLFIHHDVHPLLLDVVLLKSFGVDWLAWEAETLWAEIQRVFNQPPLPMHNKNKIQAVRTAHLVEGPWEDWETFTVMSQALNNNIPNFQVLHKPTPAQIVNTVSILNRIEQRQFSDEIQKFIAACFLDEGIYFLPKPVDFAQDEAAMLRYRCSKCGNMDRDDSNEECDVCGAPESALVKEPKFDVVPVERRYKQILSQGDDHDELQVARDYAVYRDQQLVEQTRALGDD